MKKYYPEVHQEILTCINSYRLVADRINALEEMGHNVHYAQYAKPMGSGGVGQWKTTKGGNTLVQIGYGVSQWNYAPCVELSGQPEKGQFFVDTKGGQLLCFDYEIDARIKWQELADICEVNSSQPYYYNEGGNAVGCFTDEMIRELSDPEY